MSLEKDMSVRVAGDDLDTLSVEPAPPAPVHDEPQSGASLWQAKFGNSSLAAAAASPPPNTTQGFGLPVGNGNAFLAHTLIQRKAQDGDGATSSPTSAPQPGAPSSPATATAPGMELIVEDTAPTVEPAQMKKSQFLNELRVAVCNATAQALAGTPWSEVGCPYIAHWFAYYSKQSSQHIERAIRKYAPETATVTTATGLIPPVAGRVRRAVTTWATTGEITGVPEGVPLELPGTSGLGAVGAIAGIAGVSGMVAAAGSALSSVGSLLFKERDGGSHEVADPKAIQTQLGPGQSLDSGVRSRMEVAYGESFTGVQVHADTNAAGLSENLNARAFTVGGHIAFGAGEYKPGTPIGDALIAHELAHVMQQRGAGENIAPQHSRGGAYNSLEEDADEAAVGAVVSTWSGARTRIAKSAMPSLKSGLRLQRCGDDKKPSPPPPPAAPTFEVYQARFNTLWNTAPFNAMPAADAGFDPALNSRGPRTRKARAIFDKILTDDPAMLDVYNKNTAKIRDRIDVYIGPEGLNLINSPRLTALHAAFVAHPKPVPAAGFAAFRTSVQTAAAALDPADILAVERSNEWQRLINDYVKDAAQRAEIRLIISPPAPVVPVKPGPVAPVGPRGTPAQKAAFLAAWAPTVEYNDGTRLVPWTKKATVRYLSGGQNFSVGAALPAGQTNPGLVLFIRAQLLRGAAVVSPVQQDQFQPDTNALAPMGMQINAPTPVPPKGDVLTFKVEVVEPAGAGMSVLSTKNVVVTVLPEVTYTQAQAEAAATDDDKYFHDATAKGLLGKMKAKGGIEANTAEALNAGRLVLRPLTVRHDSSAYVTAQKAGVPDPSQAGYFVGLTYANSIVLPINAGGTTLSAPPGIVVNRTTDVIKKAKRTDDEVILFFVHEAAHALDIEPSTGDPDLDSYKTEFRAYWLDGRFGPPGKGGADTIYDPNMPPPGPKSPRARKIFDHLYSSGSYPHVRKAYDANQLGFREVVDSYFIPDGINLIMSTRLDNLRALIEGWGGVGFPAFRTSVQAFVGIGPAPAGGVLKPDDRNEIITNRSWRDLVERKVTVPAEQSLIKSDLGIP